MRIPRPLRYRCAIALSVLLTALLAHPQQASASASNGTVSPIEVVNAIDAQLLGAPVNTAHIPQSAKKPTAIKGELSNSGVVLESLRLNQIDLVGPMFDGVLLESERLGWVDFISLGGELILLTEQDTGDQALLAVFEAGIADESARVVIEDPQTYDEWFREFLEKFIRDLEHILEPLGPRPSDSPSDDNSDPEDGPAPDYDPEPDPDPSDDSDFPLDDVY